MYNYNLNIRVSQAILIKNLEVPSQDISDKVQLCLSDQTLSWASSTLLRTPFPGGCVNYEPELEYLNISPEYKIF